MLIFHHLHVIKLKSIKKKKSKHIINKHSQVQGLSEQVFGVLGGNKNFNSFSGSSPSATVEACEPQCTPGMKISPVLCWLQPWQKKQKKKQMSTDDLCNNYNCIIFRGSFVLFITSKWLFILNEPSAISRNNLPGCVEIIVLITFSSRIYGAQYTEKNWDILGGYKRKA